MNYSKSKNPGYHVEAITTGKKCEHLGLLSFVTVHGFNVFCSSQKVSYYKVLLSLKVYILAQC